MDINMIFNKFYIEEFRYFGHKDYLKPFIVNILFGKGFSLLFPPIMVSDLNIGVSFVKFRKENTLKKWYFLVL